MWYERGHVSPRLSYRGEKHMTFDVSSEFSSSSDSNCPGRVRSSPARGHAGLAGSSPVTSHTEDGNTRVALPAKAVHAPCRWKSFNVFIHFSTVDFNEHVVSGLGVCDRGLCPFSYFSWCLFSDLSFWGMSVREASACIPTTAFFLLRLLNLG